jgi:hypothetical protein
LLIFGGFSFVVNLIALDDTVFPFDEKSLETAFNWTPSIIIGGTVVIVVDAVALEGIGGKCNL